VVSWAAPSGNGSAITSYEVTTSPGGITKTVPGNQTTATITDLTNGTSYTVTVVAANELGVSLPSDRSNAVSPITAPTEPRAVSAVRGDRSATVTWTAPSNDGGTPITGYRITSSPDGHVWTVAGGTTDVTATGLTNGTGYRFAVVAITRAGESSPSDPSNQIYPAGPPSRPGVITATPGDRSATVTWTAADANGAAVTGYTVTSSPGGISRSVQALSGTSTVITGLSNGVSYSFTVVAINDVGTSSASDPSNSVTPVSATLPPLPTSTPSAPPVPASVPSAPTIGAAKRGGAGGKITAVATWSTPVTNGGGPITGFRVIAYRYRANGKLASKKVSPVLAPSLRRYNMVLPAKGKYRFVCVAINDVGSSSSSARSRLVAAR
jgi:hypothetical protein